MKFPIHSSTVDNGPGTFPAACTLMVGPLLLGLLLFSGQGLAETVEDVRHALTSIGIEDSFSDCAREHSAPKKLVANFLFHADGWLELVSTEPAVSPELFACFQMVSANLELDPPGQSFAIAYPMEQAGDEEPEAEAKVEKDEINHVLEPGPNLKPGRVMYFLGLTASLIGCAGLITSHVLMRTWDGGFGEMSATMILFNAVLLTGAILSLSGIKQQQHALIKAGYAMDRKFYRASLGTFLAGVGITAAMFLTYHIFMIYWIVDSWCSEGEECDEEKEESNFEKLKKIGIALGAGQALLFLSFIPMAVMQSALDKKRLSPGKKDLTVVPYISYGFLPSRQAHVLSFTWAF